MLSSDRDMPKGATKSAKHSLCCWKKVLRCENRQLTGALKGRGLHPTNADPCLFINGNEDELKLADDLIVQKKNRR